MFLLSLIGVKFESVSRVSILSASIIVLRVSILWTSIVVSKVSILVVSKVSILSANFLYIEREGGRGRGGSVEPNLSECTHFRRLDRR